MGIGASLMVENKLSTGDFLQFTVLLGFMVAPIVQMNICSQFTEAFAGFFTGRGAHEPAPEDLPESGPFQLTELKGDIMFNDVRFAYDEGKEVLHGISFEAPAGIRHRAGGLIGQWQEHHRRPCGHLPDPDLGTVTIDGHDLSKVGLASYREHSAGSRMTFSSKGPSVKMCFSHAPMQAKKSSREPVKAHANEFTDRMELGLDTVIGERGVSLAAGATTCGHCAGHARRPEITS